MSSPGVNGQHNIANVTLLEYLREDHRPTIVLQDDLKENLGSTEPARSRTLIYSNPAFNAFLFSSNASSKGKRTSANSGFTAFIRELEAAVHGRFEFSAKAWRIRPFQQWSIIFSEDELDETTILLDSDSRDAVGGAQYIFPSGGQSPARTNSGSRTEHLSRSDSSESTPRARLRHQSSNVSLSDLAGSRSLIDWTQQDIPDMSTYVKMLKEIDWASTPLGPMQSWPMLLRQTVVEVMGNPGMIQARYLVFLLIFLF